MPYREVKNGAVADDEHDVKRQHAKALVIKFHRHAKAKIQQEQAFQYGAARDATTQVLLARLPSLFAISEVKFRGADEGRFAADVTLDCRDGIVHAQAHRHAEEDRECAQKFKKSQPAAAAYAVAARDPKE